MSELFRSPTPVSVVDCSTRLSLGLFLFLVLRSSWQGSHISASPTSLHHQRLGVFNEISHRFTQQPLGRRRTGTPLIYTCFLYLWVCTGFRQLGLSCFPPWFLGSGLLLWISLRSAPQQLTHPPTPCCFLRLFRASFGVVTVAQAMATPPPFTLRTCFIKPCVCMYCMYVFVDMCM